MLESLAYRLGIGAYSLGVRAAALHNRKASALIAGHKESIARLRHCDFSGDWVWIHAASLGEFEQGRPVIERIRRFLPEMKILLTFFSPSGYEVRKNYDGADMVCYLPFDTPEMAEWFVKKVSPRQAIFVKYEIWRNYLRALSKQSVPTYLISAAFRPGQAFFRPYGKTYRRWLHLFSRIFVQDEKSRRLLSSIGVTDVDVAGDTRFDRVTDIMRQRRDLPELEELTRRLHSEGKKILVAGSSWEPDEDVYIPWLLSRPDMAAVIAPHEFDAERLESLRSRLGKDCVLYSELTKNPEACTHARFVIVDCFGLLSSIYRFADIAHIGGGFGVGIHNINEAAVYGIPVTFGPNYHRFIEAEEIIATGGAFSVASREEFERHASRLMDNDSDRKGCGEAAGAYIKSKLGASDKVFEAIFRQNDPEKC